VDNTQKKVTGFLNPTQVERIVLFLKGSLHEQQQSKRNNNPN
jgi:hypothetical protein